MYKIILTLHSWIAMLALVMMVVAIVKSLIGWLGKKPYAKSDNGIHASAVGFLYLQLLLGLVLYFFLSPQVRFAGEVMKDTVGRFYTVEHITGMILALIIAQVARSVSKKRGSHAVAFIGFTIALVIIFGVLPWMRMEGLPMLRGL